VSQGSQKPKESTHFLALAVIRSITEQGAVKVGQRLFSPRGVLSAAYFAPPPRERDWFGIMDAACRECKLPNFYMEPAVKVYADGTRDGEMVTMVYPIEVNGPIADLFNAMNKIGNGVPSDMPAIVSRLMGAIEVFDDALIAVFVALTAKVRCLNIPPVIPLGQSELDVYEEAHTPVAAPDQSKTS